MDAAVGFNPCYCGCGLGSLQALGSLFQVLGFQSLLLWMWSGKLIFLSRASLCPSFNPCYCGCGLGRCFFSSSPRIERSFNPCYCGCGLGRQNVCVRWVKWGVSILVIVDVVWEGCAVNVS